MTGAVETFPFERLPRVARNFVSVARILGPRLNAAVLGDLAATLAPVLDVGVRVSFLSLDAGCDPTPDQAESDVVAVFSHAVRGRAWVVLDAALAVDLLSRLLRVEEIAASRELTRVERGLLGYLALVALRVAPGWRLEAIRSAPLAAPEDAVAAALEVVLGNGLRHRVRLVTDVSTLLFLPQSPPRWDRLPRLARLPLDLPIVVATARLHLAEIRSLRPGDIVVLDPSQGGELRVGRGGLPLEVTPEGLRVAGPHQPRGQRTGDTMDDKRDLLDDMPLELAAEIGRLRLSGKELLDLEPGAVLPLGRPTGAPIELTCGGRTVARGELVDVEGERGVRLTEVCS